MYRFGHVELRTATRQLLVDNEPTPLGARAFDVLLALIERRDRLVPKDELLDLVWPGLVVEENNLQVQVSALRKILGQEAIATIPGRGYRFTVTLTGGGAPGASPKPSPGNNPPQPVPSPKTLLCADRRRRAIDRRAAVREHERRSGQRVFCRRRCGGATQRALEDPRPAGGVAHVGIQLQGQQGRHPDGGAEAERVDDSRRKRPQGRQARSNHRTARPGGHRLASVVGHVRPRAGGHLCGAR
ncbi:MAG: transcriptional regulator [Betaproteobacteria bacterium]|nr:MAG: transcriptional regulator [Betaproteobacteria bacterium]